MKAKNIESSYVFIISVIITMITFFWLSKLSFSNSVFHKLLCENIVILIITIESALFGFLLTILALLLQLNNKAISFVKEFNRFNDLIKYSKRAVYSSLYLISVSILIILLGGVEVPHIIKTILHYSFGFLLIYNILSALRFINIFYMLANSN